jgi:4a-hydroxytetrahydrobiopterin dehydratase
MSLASEHCTPQAKGGPPLSGDAVQRLAKEVPKWRLEGKRLTREYRCNDFEAALGHANAVGRIAEAENHHPDLHLTGYRNLRIELTTHSLGGLSRNDFILAARIDALGEPE